MKPRTVHASRKPSPFPHKPRSVVGRPPVNPAPVYYEKGVSFMSYSEAVAALDALHEQMRTLVQTTATEGARYVSDPMFSGEGRKAWLTRINADAGARLAALRERETALIAQVRAEAEKAARSSRTFSDPTLLAGIAHVREELRDAGPQRIALALEQAMTTGDKATRYAVEGLALNQVGDGIEGAWGPLDATVTQYLRRRLGADGLVPKDAEWFPIVRALAQADDAEVPQARKDVEQAVAKGERVREPADLRKWAGSPTWETTTDERGHWTVGAMSPPPIGEDGLAALEGAYGAPGPRGLTPSDVPAAIPAAAGTST